MPCRKPARCVAIGLAAVVGAASCDNPQDLDLPEPVEVVVLTRNVYLGTDLDPLLSVSDPADLPAVAAREYANVEATRFPERAGALAREIQQTGAHLVGLQEMALYRVQVPGDAASRGTARATETSFDFLRLLLDSLDARGLAYTPAVTQQTVDLEVPALVGGAAADVRFTDREVILARSDVATSDPRQGVYAAADLVASGAGEAAVLRGYVSVLATVGGQSFRFASTHLEGGNASVQEAQAGELPDVFRSEEVPVVLVGDFNSAPGESVYQRPVAAGYRDAWSASAGAGGEPGYTCCFAPDLRSPGRTLDQRIDLVVVSAGVDPLGADILGEETGDLTRSGLRPSDHAGVAATLRVSGVP
jgi:endonuclease/exonuclease/phosphatase family metal-dependent hydrolase